MALAASCRAIEASVILIAAWCSVGAVLSTSGCTHGELPEVDSISNREAPAEAEAHVREIAGSAVLANAVLGLNSALALQPLPDHAMCAYLFEGENTTLVLELIAGDERRESRCRRIEFLSPAEALSEGADGHVPLLGVDFPFRIVAEREVGNVPVDAVQLLARWAPAERAPFGTGQRDGRLLLVESVREGRVVHVVSEVPSGPEAAESVGKGPRASEIWGALVALCPGEGE